MNSIRLIWEQARIVATLIVIALPATIITILLPTTRLRRIVARHAGRISLHAIGMPVRVSGLDLFPSEPCIVVANHASYLDGVVMMSVLPPHFSFLIKDEMRRVPLVGQLLQRLGMAFVSRSSARAAANAATHLILSARGGNAIGVFPEGTFQHEPGLQRFHLGAFLAASRANLPVVPAVIIGTRAILPSGTWRLRPQPIQVKLLTGIIPQMNGREGAKQLRDAARRAILSHNEEPDADDIKPRPLNGAASRNA